MVVVVCIDQRVQLRASQGHLLVAAACGRLSGLDPAHFGGDLHTWRSHPIGLADDSMLELVAASNSAIFFSCRHDRRFFMLPSMATCDGET